MTVTAHMVSLNDNWIKKFILETTEFSASHTAEKITGRLKEICIEWPIEHKVVCLVSDTCNTMRCVDLDFGKGLI